MTNENIKKLYYVDWFFTLIILNGEYITLKFTFTFYKGQL